MYLTNSYFTVADKFELRIFSGRPTSRASYYYSVVVRLLPGAIIIIIIIKIVHEVQHAKIYIKNMVTCNLTSLLTLLLLT